MKAHGVRQNVVQFWYMLRLKDTRAEFIVMKHLCAGAFEPCSETEAR